MGESSRTRWRHAVVLFGVVYTFVGIAFAMPASHAKFWRLAAWVVSAFAYATHIGYELFPLRNLPRSAALHIALAVALGAFGLAVGANIHSLRLGSADEHQRLLLLLSLGLGRLLQHCRLFWLHWARVGSWRVSGLGQRQSRLIIRLRSEVHPRITRGVSNRWGGMMDLGSGSLNR